MSVQADLRELLESWPYDPENDVRVTRGANGRAILQVRLPLGVEQYEMDGRPDGKRPHGKETALDHYLDKLAKATAAGQADVFGLDAGECAELFEEGTLYYYRYLHLFQIKDWERTVHDTIRNMKLFDLVAKYAERDEDRQYMEKWRPYLVRMNSMAKAMLQLEGRDFSGALRTIHDSIRAIESLPEMEEETFKFERYRSLAALRDLAAQIQKNRPLSEVERLEQELATAVAAEEFERAAQLRDRIKDLHTKGEGP